MSEKSIPFGRSPASLAAYSIKWHKASLIARQNSLERQRGELKRMEADIARTVEEIAFYERQIQTAIKKRKTSFDPDRFLVPHQQIHETF